MNTKWPLTLLTLIACACVSTAENRPVAESNPHLDSSEASKVPMVSPVSAKAFQGPLLINPEGAKRPPAKVYLPLQFAQQEQWPLVVLLHGFKGNADSQDQYLTMRNRVSSRGFILLTPDGTVTPKGTIGADGADLSGYPFWNATDFCCDFAKTRVDDVLYLTQLIELVKAKYNVDPSRVYLFGHSNGGFMANRLACEIGDQIAGIASLAGGSYADSSLCRDPKPVSYLQIHAPDDPTISYQAGAPLYAGGQATVNQWVAKNGCSPKPHNTLIKDFVTIIPGNDTSMEAWDDCSSGKTVAFWTIKPFKSKYHNGHVPIFNLDFSDAVLTFLLEKRLSK